MQRRTVISSKYRRRETIELNHVPAEIHEDVLEESISKELPLTGFNIDPEELQSSYLMKRSDKVIVKFKCHKQKLTFT